MADQILSGIRIIDISRGMAGPVATMMLAESGADVIKVEPPEGDPTREKPGFAVWNRSKRGVVLDRESSGGQEQFAKLLGGADVLVHDLGPKAAAAQGLDDATLMKKYPQLIICSIPAFPVPHPDADRPADDVLVLARSGIMDEQAAVLRDGPTYLRIPLCSIGAWHLAAAGIVARLIVRERDGVGGPAHTSLLQGSLVPLTMHWARAETPTQGFGTGMPKTNAATLFQCGDGKWMHVMANPDAAPLMDEVFAEMGEDAVNAANGPIDPNAPMQMGYPNKGANEIAFKKRPRQEWLESLWASDVPVQPCMQLGEVYFDEQANLNNYVVEVDDPTYGKTRQPGHPYTTVPDSSIKSAAPRLGEHTDDVLAEDWSPQFKATGKSSGRPPLDGIKMLDFGNFLAGPLATMFMADLGAEVIKVEATTGDMMRHGVERVFAGCQRGKRDIALNLKAPETRSVIEKLVEWADVVHHNLRYPAAQRLSIDYDSFKEINPDLIYCHTSSYGPKGARANWPGYDQLFQACSGWEYEGAGEGNQPMWHRFGMMDHQNALASTVGTLLAIYHRQKTGEPQFCAASLLGASILTISETFIGPDGNLMPYDKLDSQQMGVSQFKRIFQCADKRWVAVVADTQAEQDALMGALGVDNGDKLEGAVSAIPQDPFLWMMQNAGVKAEPVQINQMEAFFESKGSRDSNLVASYPHKTWGKVEQIGSLWNMGDIAPSFKYAPPVLGEHSKEIAEEIGLDPKLYEELKANELLIDFEG